MLSYPTYRERLEYLALYGRVGDETFGSNRWMNQRFYTSAEWNRIRHQVIVRDFGRDLALEGYDLDNEAAIYIHHIEPLTADAIANGDDILFDLNNLVCVSYDTHQKIHYGTRRDNAIAGYVERAPNDTCPWK